MPGAEITTNDLNSAPKMSDGFEGGFRLDDRNKVPYVYRYLCPLLEDSEHGYSIASKSF